MSYLLTEIALEMLGFKFYDIDGEYGPTNFQRTTGSRDKNNAEDAINGNLPNLEIAIGLDKQQSNMNGVGEQHKNVLRTSEEDNEVEEIYGTLEHIDSNNVIDLDNPAVNSILQNTAVAAVPTNQSNIEDLDTSAGEKSCSLPHTLSKLIENECEQIRLQMLQNKTLFLQTNAESIKRMEQRGGLPMTEFVKSYFRKEKKNLQNEDVKLHYFRILVQRDLMNLNPKLYNRYKSCFKLYNAHRRNERK